MFLNTDIVNLFSYRNWERILIIQPSIILKSLKRMGENFTGNMSPHEFLSNKNNDKNRIIGKKIDFEYDRKIVKALIFIKDVCAVYDNNLKLWKSNSKFQKCLNAIDSLHLHCRQLMRFKEMHDKNSFFNKENSVKSNTDNLLNLYIKYDSIQLNLEKYFNTPRYLYACNYTIKNITQYPGFHHKTSVSVPINSKLYSILLYESVNKNISPNARNVFLNDYYVIDNYMPLSVSNLMKMNDDTNVINQAYWWWDAVYARDWDLLCVLLPIAKKIENCNDFEFLFYTAIQNDANSTVIAAFVR
jgi:hypothetical protein